MSQHQDLPSARAGDGPGTVRATAATRWFASANALARQGRADAAVRTYRTLLAAHPEFTAAHANLALVLSALSRFAEAEPHFRHALTATPDEVPLLIGLAYAMQRQSRWREAQLHFQRALVLQPDCVEAMLGLGVCLRSASRLEEACEWFGQAARVDPACVDAYYLASTLKRIQIGDPLLERCEALLPQVPAMPPKRRARYWFALGRMREDVARHDDAFAAYAAGNRARASRFVLDESGEDARLQRTCATFDAKRLAAAPLRPVAAARTPVFIVGMPRAGTSLIEQILASHPDVHGAGEIQDLQKVLTAQFGDETAWPEALANPSPSVWRKLGDAYVESVWRHAPKARCVVNKTPANYRYLGAIRMMLPEARIIHAVRDPLDTCLSCYTHLFEGDSLPFSYDLGSLARYYMRYAKLMRHWREVLPDPVLDMRYEDLVTDTEIQVRRMLDRLGLTWDARCLEFHRNPRVVATASRAEVRRPVYRDSIGRWKRFEAHLGPLREQLESWA